MRIIIIAFLLSICFVGGSWATETDRAAILLQGNSEKFLRHKNGLIKYNRILRLESGLKLGEINAREEAYIPNIPISFTDKNAYYFKNLNGAYSYRIETQNSSSTPTLRNSASLEEIVAASDLASRRLLIVDERQNKQAFGLYKFNSNEFLRAEIQPVHGDTRYSPEVDPRFHLWEPLQAYLFPFVRTLPINIPKDISLNSLSSDVATIHVSIPKMAIKDTAIISIGNFNIEKYSRAEQSDPQIGYVPLLHVEYKDYQDLGGESCLSAL